MVNFFLLEDGQIMEVWIIYDRISLRDFTGVSTSASDPENGQRGFFGQ